MDSRKNLYNYLMLFYSCMSTIYERIHLQIRWNDGNKKICHIFAVFKYEPNFIWTVRLGDSPTKMLNKARGEYKKDKLKIQQDLECVGEEDS